MRRLLAVLAWLLWAACVALTFLNLYYLWLIAGVSLPERWAFPGHQVLTTAVMATPGLIIALRRNRNPVGWLILGSALLSAVEGVLTDLLVYAVVVREQTTGLIATAAWVHVWIWVPNIGLLLIPLLLVFPTGSLFSPRWRLAAALGILTTIVLFTGRAFAPGPLPELGAMDNPLGITGAEGVMSALVAAGLILLALSLSLALLAVVLRFWRSRGIERQQMKWLAFAGGVFGLTFVVMVGGFVSGLQDSNPRVMRVIEGSVALSFIGIMLAIPIAILRHRLLDIDLVINHTLVYVPLTGLLGGLYIGGIQLARALFTDLTGVTSDSVTILLVLMVASLFTPLRNTLQGIVDRTFKELRDADRELARFDREVRTVVQAFDARRVTGRFLHEAILAYQASGGTIRVHQDGVFETLHQEGETPAAVCVAIACEGRSLGEIALGPRADGSPYNDANLRTLEECAAVVGRAMLLAGWNECERQGGRGETLIVAAAPASGMDQDAQHASAL